MENRGSLDAPHTDAPHAMRNDSGSMYESQADRGNLRQLGLRAIGRGDAFAPTGAWEAPATASSSAMPASLLEVEIAVEEPR